MTISLGHLDFDHVTYDADADVLYLSVGEPQPAAATEATPEGHAVRYDERGEIVGITIVNARWFVEKKGEIELSLRLGADRVAPALVGHE